MTKSKTTAITVVSRNYFHFAVSMYETLRETNPQIPLAVYVLDEFPEDFEHPPATAGYVAGQDPNFRVIEVASLQIPNWARMSFQYTPFELACATKPFATRHALQNLGEKVLYCDADLAFFQPLTSVIEALDSCSVLLTPHFVMHNESTEGGGSESVGSQGSLDGYSTIAQAGVFNAGFYGVSSSPSANKFLDWWCDRCRSQCYLETTAGVNVDQAWLNFAPTLFDDVRVDRRPELNVAYWNLKRRGLRLDDQLGWVLGADSTPMTFFHFSGFDLSAPEKLSKFHQLIDFDVADYVELSMPYAACVHRHAPMHYSTLGCKFDSFVDGTPISPLWREAVRSNPPSLADVTNPWDPELQETLVERLEALRGQAVAARLPWLLEELSATNQHRATTTSRDKLRTKLRSFKRWVHRNTQRAA